MPAAAGQREGAPGRRSSNHGTTLNVSSTTATAVRIPTVGRSCFGDALTVEMSPVRWAGRYRGEGAGGRGEQLLRMGLEWVEPSNTEPAEVLDVASGDHEVVLEGSRGNQEVLERLAGLAMLKACPATADHSRQRKD